MRVLLLGATGNVGSRLLPALVVYKHEVVVYVRNPSKLPQEATSLATAVVSGSGTDSEAIKTAILTHKCDALINAAGLAPMWGESGELPAIFAAVTKAATEAHEQRGGPPLRVWLLSGFGILDAPTKGKMLINFVPMYTIHRHNYALIRSIPSDQLAWSLFCANSMPPRSKIVSYSPQPGIGADNLISGVDAPPAWSSMLRWIPLLGTYLNIMAQAQSYFAPLEDCVDFIAADIGNGLQSQYVGHRVGVKVKPKA